MDTVKGEEIGAFVGRIRELKNRGGINRAQTLDDFWKKGRISEGPSKKAIGKI